MKRSKIEEIEALFTKHEDESHQFERIPVKDRRSTSSDLCGLIYLQEKLGANGGKDVISCAEHDQVWLCWEEKDIKKLTEEDVIYIYRCGIWYDDDVESLTMFV